jgi:threonine synthase
MATLNKFSNADEYLECLECKQQYSIDEVRYACDCNGPIAVERRSGFLSRGMRELFQNRLHARRPEEKSGVWRYREAIRNLPPDKCIAHPEGNTNLYQRSEISAWSGVDNIFLKHEGENPSGSFKDRGMTVAISQARHLGKTIAACASTGNTSASLAAYAAQAGMKAIVFIPEGKIASGKLAQAIGYGATCMSVKGDFDSAMTLVQEVARKLDVYMVNSVNPFRLEGQKSIVWEILQDLDWNPPDWIVVPGGNLGNTSAFGKAIREAADAGWIKKRPRIATIQAEGANPFYQSFVGDFKKSFRVIAKTHATAIQIGNPVNFSKAVQAIRETNGVVAQVTEGQITEAKIFIDRLGIGCEPASACSLAGIRMLRNQGVIKKEEIVVGILTGSMLKDPESIMDYFSKLKNSARIVEVSSDLRQIEKQIKLL